MTKRKQIENSLPTYIQQRIRFQLADYFTNNQILGNNETPYNKIYDQTWGYLFDTLRTQIRRHIADELESSEYYDEET